MIEVYRVHSLISATYYRDLLEAAGIRTMLRNETLVHGVVEVPIPEFYPNIVVMDPADAVKARKLIKDDLEAREEDPGPPVKCPNCGAENPGNFGTCYACSEELPLPGSDKLRFQEEKLVVIDNYDSFTYNLVQYFGEMGVPMEVVRNDAVTIAQLVAMKPTRICVSPGPCTPNEAGISCDAIRHFGPQIPVLGVCLGHQSLAQVFGGEVVRAETLMHGKTSKIYHEDGSIFRGLPNPFTATRYHSLVVKPETLPADLEITAWTDDQVIMGLKHRLYQIHGVQFHPESILTDHGKQMLATFMSF